jgi:hypothetical protein
MPSSSTLQAGYSCLQQAAHMLGLPQGEAGFARGDDDALGRCREEAVFTGTIEE